MPSIIARCKQTLKPYKITSSEWDKVIDESDTTYGSVEFTSSSYWGGSSSSNPRISGFDLSEIPDNVVIDKIKLYFLTNNSVFPSLNHVFKMSSDSDYAGTKINVNESIPSRGTSGKTCYWVFENNSTRFNELITPQMLNTRSNNIGFMFTMPTGTTQCCAIKLEVFYHENTLIFNGENAVTSAYLGNQSISAIYIGDKKLL